jgi:hypothetical protein
MPAIEDNPADKADDQRWPRLEGVCDREVENRAVSTFQIVDVFDEEGKTQVRDVTAELTDGLAYP